MVKDAVELMNQNKISQLPIIEGSNNLGSITAKKIQKLIADNPDMIKINVMLIKELPFPEIQKDWDVKEISDLLVKYNAVSVKEFNTFIGIITNADFFKII
ncbi:MAG: CBS domain-containing protein [Candidatus Lokiarchaeota archaeon]|nr:CBS domain-containing protein [Candidatus Lokiarchaeota archaeon]MCK4281004.1 CBS domain-containing protein [Candidatus Lokiarchaeota archaeon]